MNFGAHLREKAQTSAGLFSRLRGVARTKWGIKDDISYRLYGSVFVPRMGYAASVWAEECMIWRKNRTSAIAAQRFPLLAITGAYKMASTAALQVLAGVPPLDLELIRLSRIEKDKTAVRKGAMTADEAAMRRDQHLADTILLWQRRWVADDKGRWLPDVGLRLARGWLTVDHYTCQLMTGHGNFGASLHRFNLRGDAACSCGCPLDTAEHVLFECTHHRQERQTLESAVRAAGADWPCNLELMAETEAMFLALKKFAREAMQRREQGEVLIRRDPALI